MVPFFRGWRSCAPSDLPLTKLVVGKRSGEILLNSTWKVRTERTQPLVVWPLVLIVSPLADEERELLEWLASHGLTRFAARITKVSYDLDDRRAYRRGHRERRVPDSCEGADLEKRDSVPPRGQGIIGSSPIGCLSRPHDSPTLIDTPRKRAAWGAVRQHPHIPRARARIQMPRPHSEVCLWETRASSRPWRLTLPPLPAFGMLCTFAPPCRSHAPVPNLLRVPIWLPMPILASGVICRRRPSFADAIISVCRRP